MSHIHTQPGQHDLTASAFIIRTDGTEPKVMLHHHLKAGVLLQFGGHIELDESPWHGLLRELREESGYDVDQLCVLQPPGGFFADFTDSQNQPVPFTINTHRFMQEHHFHSDLVYAATASEAPNIKLDPRESASIHLFTLAQLSTIPSTEIYEETRTHAIYLLSQLLHMWEAVPAIKWITHASPNS